MLHFSLVWIVGHSTMLPRTFSLSKYLHESKCGVYDPKFIVDSKLANVKLSDLQVTLESSSYGRFDVTSNDYYGSCGTFNAMLERERRFQRYNRNEEEDTKCENTASVTKLKQ